MSIKDDISAKSTERPFDYYKIPELLKRFTYKPNWVIDAEYRIDHDVVRISLRQYVEDSRESFRPWHLVRKMYQELDWDPFPNFRLVETPEEVQERRRAISSMISPQRPVLPVVSMVDVPREIDTESEFWYWLRYDGIPALEDHEMDEWFKVDGMLLFDPHSEKPLFLTVRELEIRNRAESVRKRMRTA